MSINIKLLKHIKSKEDKEEIKRLFKRNHRVVNVLLTYLSEELANIEKEVENVSSNVHSPNFSLAIVEQLTRLKTYKEVRDILISTQE